MQPNTLQSPKTKPNANGQTVKSGPKGGAGAGSKPHTHFEVTNAGVKEMKAAIEAGKPIGTKPLGQHQPPAGT